MSNFIFPNGIDTFTPTLINNVTIVNAQHVLDLRTALTDIENALVGTTSIPYSSTYLLVSTDTIKHALEKFDAVLYAITQQIGLDTTGNSDYDAYGSRVDSLQNQLEAHRVASGPYDSDGYTVHNVLGQVVGTLNDQALINKTIDSGTWSTGPKFIARGGSGDPGNKMIEVYSAQTQQLSAWIDEQGNASFNNVIYTGTVTELGTDVIQSSLIVDGYTILGTSAGTLAGTPAFGTARNYSVLAASAVIGSTGAGSTLTGNLGIYPGTSITNFPPSTYTGTEDKANSNASTAQASAQVAYTDLSTRSVGPIVSVLDGLTLTPGLYTSHTSMSLAASGPATLTLNGAGVYVFQIGSTLTTGAGGIPTIVLTNGALAANIYWAVGSSATLNSGSPGTFYGNVIAQASITVTAGGTLNGTLAALTGAVTLSATTNIIAQPLSTAPGTNYTIINGPLTVNGPITSTGPTELTGQDGYFGNYTGTAQFNYANSDFSGNVEIGGTLMVTGLSSLGANLGDPLQINGNAVVEGSLSVFGAFSALGNIQLGQDPTVSTLLTGLLNTFNITVGSAGSGSAVFNSSLIVNKNLTVNGTSLYFGPASGSPTGTAVFNTMLTHLQGGLVVDETTQLNQTLNVGTYPTSIVNAFVSGNLTVYGSLQSVTLSNPILSGAEQIQVVAGQSFSANITHAVRWGQPLNGEIANRVYATSSLYPSSALGFGFLLSTTAVAPGGTANVTIAGTHTLGTSDFLFASNQVGQLVFIDDAYGSFSTTPTSTQGALSLTLGIVRDVNEIWVDFKGAQAVTPTPPIYDERQLYPTGLPAYTSVTIPVNSRNNNVQQTYTPLSGELFIFINQEAKYQGADWTSVDSQTVQFTYALPANTEVHYRIEPTSSGILITSSGGSDGYSSLQSAYQAGPTVTITPGVPITLGTSGPYVVGNKLLQINGDIGITGIVDPSAVELSPQSSSPLTAGQYGIWADAYGQLCANTSTGTITVTSSITQLLNGSAITSITRTYTNSTASTIPAYTPVYTPAYGQIAPANGTFSSTFQVIGLTTQSILAGQPGLVAMQGYVPGAGNGYSHNSNIYLGGYPGNLAGVLTTLAPSIANGYPVGFNVIRIGIVENNGTGNNSIILQIQYMGSLA